jgi:hypothetical protein
MVIVVRFETVFDVKREERVRGLKEVCEIERSVIFDIVFEMDDSPWRP